MCSTVLLQWNNRYLIILFFLLSLFLASAEDTLLNSSMKWERYYSNSDLQHILHIKPTLHRLYFDLRSTYYGQNSLFTTVQTRDDYSLTILSSYQLSETYTFQFINDLFYASDSRSLQLKGRLRIRAIPTIIWNGAIGNSVLQGGAGVLYDEQINHADFGTGILLRGSYTYDFQDVLLTFQTNSSWSWLKERENGNLDAQVAVTGATPTSKFSLNALYRIFRNDYYLPYQESTGESIEQRRENAFTLSSQFFYFPSKLFQISLHANANLERIFRSNNYFLPQIPETALLRKLQRDQATVRLAMQHSGEKIRVNIAIAYRSHAEDESVLPTAVPLPSSQIEQYQRQANIRDFQRNDRELFSELHLPLSRNDTTKTTFLISLTRYNTPSELNFDDRDELRTIWDAEYRRKFSHFFQFRLISGLEYHHFVYLKAQRSAQNYKEYKIFLVPSISWNTTSFHSSLSLLLSSHYVVYDFEHISQTPQSYSIRQIGIRDSLIIELAQRHYALLYYTIRYSERGQLFWKTFSEIPETRNYDHLVSAMIYRKLHSSRIIGIGLRWFLLQQLSFYGNAPQNSVFVIGPQLDLMFHSSPQFSLHLTGWYELHFKDSKLVIQRPLLNLESKITL